MKPLCILSKSERRGRDDTMVFANKFQHIFEGLIRIKIEGRDDIPEWALSRCLWRYGSIGITDKGDVCQAKPGVRDIYGRPKVWTPVPMHEDKNFKRVPQKTPVLERIPFFERVEPYFEIFDTSALALRMNIIGLMQPPVFSGPGEAQIDAEQIWENIQKGEIQYVVIPSGIAPFQVLDTKVTDYSNSLTNLISWITAMIYIELGIPAAAVEKASGLSTEELQSGFLGLEVEVEGFINVLEKWATDTSTIIGKKVTIEFNDKYIEEFLEKQDETEETAPEAPENGKS